MKILDLSNKFTVSLGDLRTDLEANKWLQTRRSLCMSLSSSLHMRSNVYTTAMISLALVVVITVSAYTSDEPPPVKAPPTAADLGLTPSGTPAYLDAPIRRLVLSKCFVIREADFV